MKLRSLTSRAVASAVLVLSGCSAPPEPSPPTPSAVPRPPAEPARAPGLAATPIGRVVAIGTAPEGVVIGDSGIGAVAVRKPDGVTLFDATTGAVRKTVATKGAARHLSLAGPDGPALVPLESSDELIGISLADGRITFEAPGVGHQPHDAAQTAQGTIVVTNERGGGVVFVRDGRVVSSLPAGPPQPGGVAAVGDYAAVADVQGNGVWVYDGATRRQVAQGPAGLKLTHAVTLGERLAAFADTDGGAIIVMRIDPRLTQVSRIDAPGKPYGMAYDRQRRRLYVTLTAANLMRVIDMADASAPRVLADVATVQQPNSVAVDPRSGAVVVTGSTASTSALEIIAPELLPRG